MKIDKKYQLAKIELDGSEESEYVYVFMDWKCGKRKFSVLNLKDIEKVLNEQDEMLKEKREIIKRNQSLQTRVSKLREEVDYLKKHQVDGEIIKEVCKVIQERIDFVGGEPTLKYVSDHMRNVKKQLKEKGLWRE